MSSSTHDQPTALRDRVRHSLDRQPQLRPMLFPFGFLITPATVHVPLEGFPFYGRWHRTEVGSYAIHHHPDQPVFVVNGETRALFLIGHAYDPVAMIADEVELLRAMRDAREVSMGDHIEALNRLTGIFVTGVVEGDELTLYSDAVGMQTVFYGSLDGVPHVTSHAALVGSLYDLESTEYVKRLTNYRFYPLFGRALPGDLSPYAELRRLVPNHLAMWSNGKFTVSRFFPVAPQNISSDEDHYREAVRSATQIMQNSMALIAQKWNMPAISLTGGCDSQTTLACVAPNYDRFRYFSYVSTPEEEVDANAAKAIAEHLGLDHELFRIPIDEIRQREDFEAISGVLELNFGDIGNVRPSEVAKRIILRESDIDIEVKSWNSEVVRAAYHKRFSKRSFPKSPTARYLTTLYKVFLNDRQLARMTDQVFEDYLERYYTNEVFDRMAWWDLVYWELGVGLLRGAVITSDHRVSFDIEIPYNNRLLLQTLLTTPLAARIVDQPHRDIRELANPEINKLGVSVVNVKHTKRRARFERAYLEVHSRLPF